MNHEEELLSILLKYPLLIDKLNFSRNYFENELIAKTFDYLKVEKEINPQKMIKMFNINEFQYIIELYTNCIYDKGAESMAFGFAKIILENYKTRREKKLREEFDLGIIDHSDYIYENNLLNNLSVESEIELITDELLDQVILEQDKGLKIKRFEILSSYLNLVETDLVTIAGTSGFGKSAFVLNLFQSLSQDESGNFKCQYYNLEISPKTIIKRLLSITSNHRIDEINAANATKDFIKDARKKVKTDSFIQTGSITIEDMKAKILNNIDESKTNIVFVDHIGILGVANKLFNKTEYDRTTYCMKELRNLALDNNLIIFVVSQLDRESIRNGKISIHSLKSSGEIENSSSHILLLKKSQKKETTDSSSYEEVMIDLGKNRNGVIATLDYYTFIKSKQIFVEVSR